MIMERMNKIEKKMEEKNSEMVRMLHSITAKICEHPPSSARPSFTHSYANVAAPVTQPSTQGQQQSISIQRGNLFRERSASFKRARSENEVSVSNKRKNVDKQIVVGWSDLEQGRIVGR